MLEFYVEAVLATYAGGLKKTRVSIAGPGPALLAVLEGLMYYNFPDNSPSRTVPADDGRSRRLSTLLPLSKLEVPVAQTELCARLRSVKRVALNAVLRFSLPYTSAV